MTRQKLRRPGPGSRPVDPAHAAKRAGHLAIAVATGVATGVLVLGIALLVRGSWSPLTRLDEAAVEAGTRLAAGEPGLLRTLVVWQTVFLARNLVIPVLGLCAWFWWRTRDTARTCWAAATVLSGWALSNVLKEVVRRARPVLDEPVESAHGYSFPSGHATNTALMTTVLVLLVWPALRSRGLRIAAVSTAAVLTVLTAVDRVMLGVHYPSDVVAGMLLGVGFALASYLGFRHLFHPRDEKGGT